MKELADKRRVSQNCLRMAASLEVSSHGTRNKLCCLAEHVRRCMWQGNPPKLNRKSSFKALYNSHTASRLHIVFKLNTVNSAEATPLGGLHLDVVNAHA